MSTMRAMSGYGGKKRRIDQQKMRNLFEMIHSNGRGFLLPPLYRGCSQHEWKLLDSGFCVCVWCGSEHNCTDGKCPEEKIENGEMVCTITGCITLEYEMRVERNASERVVMLTVSKLETSPLNIRDSVELTVREIIASPKTEICMQQEGRRNEAKELAVFSRTLRDIAHDSVCSRPNMILVIENVMYQCRKNRLVDIRKTVDLDEVAERCTESITNLLLLHGGPRVSRQIQNASRCREFVCSMLYLMRMGITFQNRQLLPKMEILNLLLPLQVLLPSVFKIRAKSITEGENIIKLDIRKMPL